MSHLLQDYGIWCGLDGPVMSLSVTMRASRASLDGVWSTYVIASWIMDVMAALFCGHGGHAIPMTNEALSAVVPVHRAGQGHELLLPTDLLSSLGEQGQGRVQRLPVLVLPEKQSNACPDSYQYDHNP